MRKLPPLNAVRAFEAAGRHVSFTKAGEELCVTHGAVSRQVAQLEQYLGTKLFRRTASQLEPGPISSERPGWVMHAIMSSSRPVCEYYSIRYLSTAVRP